LDVSCTDSEVCVSSIASLVRFFPRVAFLVGAELAVDDRVDVRFDFVALLVFFGAGF
jgi:hypothetical protein